MTNRLLAGAAVLLAAGALLAGDSGRAEKIEQIDLGALARAVEREEDHIDAIDLAEWIRDRKPGLRVIDVRDRADYEQYHIPQAQRVAISAIPELPVESDDV